MKSERVLQQANTDQVQVVRFRSLELRLLGGIGLSAAMQVMNMFDVLTPREDLGLSGPLRIPEP